MIAALPMYDWPETSGANDVLWARLSAQLQASNVDVPAHLTRTNDLEALWLSPELLLAQTCSYPLETSLKGKVRYVATPSYSAQGCETPGHYRSVVLMRGQAESVFVPRDSRAKLPFWHRDVRLAINGLDSMSGYNALKRDALAEGCDMPEVAIVTGSHRASIKAVVNGQADLCTVDCITWAMALQYEPAAQEVFVAGWTKQRPGLPLITSLSCPEDLMAKLMQAAQSVLGAVVLASPTEF